MAIPRQAMMPIRVLRSMLALASWVGRAVLSSASTLQLVQITQHAIIIKERLTHAVAVQIFLPRTLTRVQALGHLHRR
jgi:hypothetical protein